MPGIGNTAPEDRPIKFCVPDATVNPFFDSIDKFYEAVGGDLFVSADDLGFRRAYELEPSGEREGLPVMVRGLIEAGDILGPWLIDDLLACLNYITQTVVFFKYEPEDPADNPPCGAKVVINGWAVWLERDYPDTWATASSWDGVYVYPRPARDPWAITTMDSEDYFAALAYWENPPPEEQGTAPDWITNASLYSFAHVPFEFYTLYYIQPNGLEEDKVTPDYVENFTPAEYNALVRYWIDFPLWERPYWMGNNDYIVGGLRTFVPAHTDRTESSGSGYPVEAPYSEPDGDVRGAYTITGSVVLNPESPGVPPAGILLATSVFYGDALHARGNPGAVFTITSEPYFVAKWNFTNV